MLIYIVKLIECLFTGHSFKRYEPVYYLGEKYYIEEVGRVWVGLVSPHDPEKTLIVEPWEVKRHDGA